MFLSSNLGFVAEDRVHRADGDATECGDGFAVELLDSKQHICLIHCLKVEVGADDAVAVDHGPAHVCADCRGVRGLDCGCRDWCGREAIESADQEVDQV